MIVKERNLLLSLQKLFQILTSFNKAAYQVSSCFFKTMSPICCLSLTLLFLKKWDHEQLRFQGYEPNLCRFLRQFLKFS